MVDFKTITNKVQKLFNENSINHFFSVDFNNGTIEVEVEWGDWKHDHLYLERVMKNNGYTMIDSEVTEEDGSDTYSARYWFL